MQQRRKCPRGASSNPIVLSSCAPVKSGPGAVDLIGKKQRADPEYQNADSEIPNEGPGPALDNRENVCYTEKINSGAASGVRGIA